MKLAWKLYVTAVILFVLAVSILGGAGPAVLAASAGFAMGALIILLANLED